MYIINMYGLKLVGIHVHVYLYYVFQSKLPSLVGGPGGGVCSYELHQTTYENLHVMYNVHVCECISTCTMKYTETPKLKKYCSNFGEHCDQSSLK